MHIEATTVYEPIPELCFDGIEYLPIHPDHKPILAWPALCFDPVHAKLTTFYELNPETLLFPYLERLTIARIYLVIIETFTPSPIIKNSYPTKRQEIRILISIYLSL